MIRQGLLFFITFIMLFSCNGMEIPASSITFITSDNLEFLLSRGDAQKSTRIQETLSKHPESNRIHASAIDGETFQYIFYHLTGNGDETFQILASLNREELLKLKAACESLKYDPMLNVVKHLLSEDLADYEIGSSSTDTSPILSSEDRKSKEVIPSNATITIITSDEQKFTLWKHSAKKLGPVMHYLRRYPEQTEIIIRIDADTFRPIYNHLVKNEEASSFKSLEKGKLEELYELCSHLEYSSMKDEIVKLLDGETLQSLLLADYEIGSSSTAHSSIFSSEKGKSKAVISSSAMITIITSDGQEFTLWRSNAKKLERLNKYVKHSKTRKIKARKIDQDTFQHIYNHLENNENASSFKSLDQEGLIKLYKGCSYFGYYPMMKEIQELLSDESNLELMNQPSARIWKAPSREKDKLPRNEFRKHEGASRTPVKVKPLKEFAKESLRKSVKTKPAIEKDRPHIKFDASSLRGYSKDNLDLSTENLTLFPMEICNLIHLKSLNLSFNRISELPEELSKLQQLEKLSLTDHRFKTFPEIICTLVSLKELSLCGVQFPKLPENFSRLRALENFSMSSRKLEEFPEVITQCTSLKSLFMGWCNLESVPRSISSLSKLDRLYLNNNRLTDVPDEIFSLPHLKYLNLSKNPINYKRKIEPQRLGKVVIF